MVEVIQRANMQTSVRTVCLSSNRANHCKVGSTTTNIYIVITWFLCTDFFHVFYSDNIQLVIDKIEGGFPIFPYEKLLDFVCNKTVHCEFEYLNQRMGSPGSQLVNGQLDLNRTENIKYEELNRACMILMPKCFQIDHQIVNILGAFQASEAQIITIIKMAKQLSSFRKLSIDDQIIVLKGSIREILPLWNVVVYDRQFNCIVYYNVGVNTLPTVSQEYNFYLSEC